MLLQSLPEIIEQVFHAIEVVLPYLIPFMSFILPLVQGLGNLLRGMVAPVYNLIDVGSIDYAHPSYLIYILTASGVAVVALVLAIKWPNRPKQK